MTDTERLGIYLNDHLAGSTLGLDHFRRVAKAHDDPAVAEALRRIGRETKQDRDALVATMRRLGVRRTRYKGVAGMVLSQLSRLKPNGSLLGRSPMDTFIELESLYLGVTGKRALWSLLLDLCAHESRLDRGEVSMRLDQAERHREALDRLRRQEGLRVLA